MFLNLLSEEKKELFLDLSFRIASADGNYSDEEKAMISAYQQEMNTNYDPVNTVRKPNDIIAQLNLICSAQEKRIIVFEVIGLALADRDYDDREKKIIVLMESLFDLGGAFAETCEDLINKYLALQDSINELVLKG